MKLFQMKMNLLNLTDMKLLTLSLFLMSAPLLAQQALIEDAVLPLPENLRANATVISINENGDDVILRLGTNEQVCLTDNPNLDGFGVACYHKDLEPFMKRGRELRKEGKKFQEIFDTREKEAKSGKLIMPQQATNLVVMSGKDKASASLRWVVYLPFQTAESTGLALKPNFAGAPWLMYPGTHAAHIMISPPNP